MSELKVTSIEELKSYTKGDIVELPEFGNGQKFVARLKRPSMLALMKSGKIPNSLLQSANTLFEKGPSGVLNSKNVNMENIPENVMSQMFDIMDIICESSFVEPTYKQIKDSNIELTDEQLLFVFSYSQNGVKDLESFRV